MSDSFQDRPAYTAGYALASPGLIAFYATVAALVLCTVIFRLAAGSRYRSSVSVFEKNNYEGKKLSYHVQIGYRRNFFGSFLYACWLAVPVLVQGILFILCLAMLEEKDVDKWLWLTNGTFDLKICTRNMITLGSDVLYCNQDYGPSSGAFSFRNIGFVFFVFWNFFLLNMYLIVSEKLRFRANFYIPCALWECEFVMLEEWFIMDEKVAKVEPGAVLLAGAGTTTNSNTNIKAGPRADKDDGRNAAPMAATTPTSSTSSSSGKNKANKRKNKIKQQLGLQEETAEKDRDKAVAMNNNRTEQEDSLLLIISDLKVCTPELTDIIYDSRYLFAMKYVGYREIGVVSYSQLGENLSEAEIEEFEAYLRSINFGPEDQDNMSCEDNTFLAEDSSTEHKMDEKHYPTHWFWFRCTHYFYCHRRNCFLEPRNEFTDNDVNTKQFLDTYRGFLTKTGINAAAMNKQAQTGQNNSSRVSDEGREVEELRRSSSSTSAEQELLAEDFRQPSSAFLSQRKYEILGENKISVECKPYGWYLSQEFCDFTTLFQLHCLWAPSIFTNWMLAIVSGVMCLLFGMRNAWNTFDAQREIQRLASRTSEDFVHVFRYVGRKKTGRKNNYNDGVVGPFSTTTSRGGFEQQNKFLQPATSSVQNRSRPMFEMESVHVSELVPGDLVEIPATGVVPCDCVVVEGAVVVNESNLTGEAMPIQKFALEGNASERLCWKRHAKKNILCAGTAIMQSRGKTGNDPAVAVVLATAAGTTKGLMIRSIIYAEEVHFELYDKLPIAVLMNATFAGVVAMLTIFSQAEWQALLIAGYFEAVCAISRLVSPLILVGFKITQGQAAARLKSGPYEIQCLSYRRIPMAGKMEVQCFDKTGTLTEESLHLHAVQAALLSAKHLGLEENFYATGGATSNGASSCATGGLMTRKQVEQDTTATTTSQPPLTVHMGALHQTTSGGRDMLRANSHVFSLADLAASTCDTVTVLDDGVTLAGNKVECELVHFYGMDRDHKLAVKRSHAGRDTESAANKEEGAARDAKLIHRHPSDGRILARTVRQFEFDQRTQLQSVVVDIPKHVLDGALEPADLQYVSQSGTTTTGDRKLTWDEMAMNQRRLIQNYDSRASVIGSATPDRVDQHLHTSPLLLSNSRDTSVADHGAQESNVSTPVMQMKIEETDADFNSTSTVYRSSRDSGTRSPAGGGLVPRAQHQPAPEITVFPPGGDPAFQRNHTSASVASAASVSPSPAPTSAATRFLFAKGSPIKVASQCRPDSLPQDFHARARHIARSGYYLLALACRPLLTEELQTAEKREDLEQDLTFLGLLYFKNELKSCTATAIAELQDAGIFTVMVTGDNLWNGLHVAKECGLIPASHAGSILLADAEEKKTPTGAKRGQRIVEKKTTTSNLLAVPSASMDGIQGVFMNNEKRKEFEAEETGPPVDHPDEDQTTSSGTEEEDTSSSEDDNEDLEKKPVEKQLVWTRDIPLLQAISPSKPNVRASRVFARGAPRARCCSSADPGYDEKIESLIEDETTLFGVTQHAFTYLKEHDPELLHQIFPRVVIFGSMSPQGKVDVVSKWGASKVVGMCGDGGNDSGALKMAHVGMALVPKDGTSEVSIVSPFSSSGGVKPKVGESGSSAAQVEVISPADHEKRPLLLDYSSDDKINADTHHHSAASKRERRATEHDVPEELHPDPSIHSVVSVVKEGRAVLENSVACYQFFVYYGCLSVISKMFLQVRHGYYSELVFLFQDAFLVVAVTYAIASSKPSLKVANYTPSANILGYEICCGILSPIGFSVLALFLTYRSLDAQPWFVAPDLFELNIDVAAWWSKQGVFTAAVTGSWSVLSAVGAALLFSLGGKQRRAWFRNWILLVVVCVVVPLWTFLLFTANNPLNCVFRVNCDNETSWATTFQPLTFFLNTRELYNSAVWFQDGSGKTDLLWVSEQKLSGIAPFQDQPAIALTGKFCEAARGFLESEKNNGLPVWTRTTTSGAEQCILELELGAPASSFQTPSQKAYHCQQSCRATWSFRGADNPDSHANDNRFFCWWTAVTDNSCFLVPRLDAARKRAMGPESQNFVNAQLHQPADVALQPGGQQGRSSNFLGANRTQADVVQTPFKADAIALRDRTATNASGPHRNSPEEPPRPPVGFEQLSLKTVHFRNAHNVLAWEQPANTPLEESLTQPSINARTFSWTFLFLATLAIAFTINVLMSIFVIKGPVGVWLSGKLFGDKKRM
ncbi:unnamed protein product [Amoebophrya sp. A120]|nr:unnamed protein product [Amoebophrya sp. A120]|eukprot:GSA120T00018180001.1